MASTRQIKCDKVTTRDPRIIRLFERRLSLSGSATREDLSTDSRLNTINNEIFKNKKSHNEINEFIERIQNEYVSTHIEQSELDWIENNNTLMCYILWSIIKLTTLYRIKNSKNIFVETTITKDSLSFSHNEIFNSSIFSLATTENRLYNFPNRNKKERLIELIDSIPLVKDRKRSLIKEIQGKYLELKNSDYLTWIDENDNNQTEWIISYLKRNKLNIDALSSNGVSSYYAIVSSFFLWDYKSIHEVCGSKDMFIFKIRKAWNQKKHRDNNKKKKKKEYNILMSDDIGDKMDFIAESHESKKNKIVEMLINKEYQRLKNGQ
ncbi:hypothetical protein [Vibrio fortis]|uniref:hypothetical protein n=1 Tax=Vibrio fortis TaxID=212667 RepID=UPI0038CD6CE3